MASGGDELSVGREAGIINLSVGNLYRLDFISAAPIPYLDHSVGPGCQQTASARIEVDGIDARWKISHRGKFLPTGNLPDPGIIGTGGSHMLAVGTESGLEHLDGMGT